MRVAAAETARPNRPTCRSTCSRPRPPTDRPPPDHQPPDRLPPPPRPPTDRIPPAPRPPTDRLPPAPRPPTDRHRQAASRTPPRPERLLRPKLPDQTDPPAHRPAPGATADWPPSDHQPTDRLPTTAAADRTLPHRWGVVVW